MEAVTLTDLLLIGSTFLGPILAVGFTLWYQEYSALKGTRSHLFATMMRLRRDATNAEFVGALNLVPVHFSRKRKVMECYGSLMSLLEDPGWHSGQEAALKALHERVDLAIAYLLAAMSKAVGTPVEQLRILRGAYAPQGWLDDRQLNREMQVAFHAILTGKHRLPVDVAVPGSSTSQELSTLEATEAELLENRTVRSQKARTTRPRNSAARSRATKLP